MTTELWAVIAACGGALSAAVAKLWLDLKDERAQHAANVAALNQRLLDAAEARRLDHVDAGKAIADLGGKLGHTTALLNELLEREDGHAAQPPDRRRRERG